VLTYALLVRDPDLVGSAFTLSGMLPAPLVPSAWPLGKPKPAVHAYHGKLDDIVAIDDDRTGVASLKGLGVQATLKEYPLLTHSMGPLEMADARPKIEEALRAEARALSRTSP
jgi:phospholipase/carboxylesterase